LSASEGDLRILECLVPGALERDKLDEIDSVLRQPARLSWVLSSDMGCVVNETDPKFVNAYRCGLSTRLVPYSLSPLAFEHSGACLSAATLGRDLSFNIYT
jgi:hypothetical protein